MKVMGVVALEGKIWVVGESCLYKYDPMINCWITMPSPPVKFEAGSTTSFSGASDRDMEILVEKVDPGFMDELRRM